MDKIKRRARRKKSIRKKISGTQEKPRMSIHKTNRDLYVQLVDDVAGKTICGLSTKSKAVKQEKTATTRKNINYAKALGESIAKAATEKGVTKVVFDRSGYVYHGVVKAIADSARKNGLQF